LKKNNYDKSIILRDQPFFGLPVSVKETIALKGTITNFGFLDRKNDVIDHDSDFSSCNLALGAIPICKSSSVSMLVMSSGTNMTIGNVMNP